MNYSEKIRILISNNSKSSSKLFIFIVLLYLTIIGQKTRTNRIKTSTKFCFIGSNANLLYGAYFQNFFFRANTQFILIEFLSVSFVRIKNWAKWEKSWTCMSKPHRSDNVISFKDAFSICYDHYLFLCISGFAKKFFSRQEIPHGPESLAWLIFWPSRAITRNHPTTLITLS